MALTLRRRKALKPEPMADDVVVKKAVDAVAKAFLTGNAAKMPGTSWSNQGTVNNALIARVTQNLASSFGRAPAELEAALAEHGLSWGPPFPPGRPLDPFWGYRRPPRTWDYSVGENVQLVPRWNRISFPTLKAIIDSYYAAQIAVRHLINDVRSLDYQFIPPQNVLEDATEDIQKAEEFFASPDKRQPFRTWLAEYLQDVLRYDAGSLYIRRNEAGDPIALEVISGSTLIPLVDFFGRPPADEDDTNADPEGIWEGDTTPAFVQIIEGLPWVWLTADDIIYQRLNPLPESQYGLAPMEAVLIQANTDIRFQWHFLQFFTEGTIPAGFMEAPPDLSDPIQVQEWQETWDAVMLGDQSKLNQIRWVPGGAKFTPIKETVFDKEFPLYLMRCTAAAFGVTANDLGFTEDVNRATGEVQVDVQFRVGTLPVVRFVEDVINQFILENLKLKARIQFDTGQGTQHRLEIAQANDIYIKNGTLSSDEVRLGLGKRISREIPMPRIIDNTRGGPIPLLSVHSLAGKVDPTTYGPHAEQQFIDHPFISAPGTLPVIGSQDYKDAQNSTAQMQTNMALENADPRSAQQFRPAMQPPMITKPATGDGPTQPKNAQKDALGEAYEVIDALLDRLGVSKDGTGIDNTGGPGVTRGFSNPTTVTGGLMVDTGIQGVDLIGPKLKKDPEDDDEEVEKVLRQWRENSLNRIRKGLPPRRFEDAPFPRRRPHLGAPASRSDPRRGDRGLLASVGKSGGPDGGLNREAAGILVQAEDTGRVLLVQRLPDKHDEDEAYARWEFPGGRLDGGHGDQRDPSVWAGGLREWREETGADLPSGTEPVGGWTSDDGVYEGFVVRVPRESDLSLNPQRAEVSTAKWWDPADLDDPRIREKVTEQLGDIKPLLKSFHRHTDAILAHYTPLIQDSMAQVIEGDTVRHAIRAAYTSVHKQMQPTAPGSQNTPKYQRQLQALISSPQTVVGAAGIGAGAALAGPALATAGGVGGAVLALLNAQLSLGALTAVLTALYGDALLQGAYEASQASGKPLPSLGLPDGYWDQWVPGHNELAAQLPGGTLQELLQAQGVTIRGISETQLNRIADAIAEAVRDGVPMKQTVAKVEAIIGDATRAKLIAETEFARASTAARRAIYRANHVAQVAWLAHPDACELCKENEAVSPKSLRDSWPNGDVPVHPLCRCVEVPV